MPPTTTTTLPPTTTTTLPPTTTSTTTTSTTTTSTTTTTTAPPTQTDWELIQTDPQLSDYTAGFAERPELVELVDGSNVVTVFAPTNAATAQVANWDDIVADDAAFDSFVRSHLISGAVTAEELFTGTEPYELTTLGGDTITVDPVNQTINGASIVSADTPGTNGIVHTVDGLFIVPDVTPPTTSTTSTTTG